MPCISSEASSASMTGPGLRTRLSCTAPPHDGASNGWPLPWIRIATLEPLNDRVPTCPRTIYAIPLPDEITLSREEAGALLAALDVAETSVLPNDRNSIRRAIRIVTSKLWPDLGDLLYDDE